jgi:hypothetical protein
MNGILTQGYAKTYLAYMEISKKVRKTPLT